MEKPEWFKNWFNSPYYHILYRNRDEKEAAAFIDKLTEYLELDRNDFIWDLACGKGRHSVYLNKKGLTVTGTDLSANSIKEASASENASLEFFVHDMRVPFRVNYFTHVFNLFTSIGYFENFQDNLKVFKNVYAALKPGGIFVLDFFNASFVLDCLKMSDTKTVEGIDFHIRKEVKNKHVVKTISFKDQGHDFRFEEKVSLLRYEDFTSFSQTAGFRLKHTFGDYNLNPFYREKSDRLILIFEK